MAITTVCNCQVAEDNGKQSEDTYSKGEIDDKIEDIVIEAGAGTVTSVGIQTGTSGSNINISGSPVTTTGTITINIPTASATNRGALSTTDWSHFNSAYSWGDHAGLYRLVNWVPSFADISSKPTTLSGFGITDAMSTSHAANGISGSDITNWNAKLSNITGLISHGSNVTITGNGTNGSPYVITFSGTGGTGTGLSESEVNALIEAALNAKIQSATVAIARKDSGDTYVTPYQLELLQNTVIAQAEEITALQTWVSSHGGSDLTPPHFSSAQILNASPTIVRITLDKNDLNQDSISTTASFTVNDDGTPVTVSSVDVVDSVILVTITPAAEYASVYTFSYTPGANAIQDISGNKLASQSNRSITNNVAQAAQNMINNGTFASATGWTLNAGVTISNGVVNIPRANTWFSQLEADMQTALTANTNYRLTFDLAAPNGNIDIQLWDAGNSTQLTTNTVSCTSGANTIDFTTPASLNYDKGIRFRIFYSEEGSMDNVVLSTL